MKRKKDRKKERKKERKKDSENGAMRKEQKSFVSLQYGNKKKSEGS